MQLAGTLLLYGKVVHVQRFVTSLFCVLLVGVTLPAAAETGRPVVPTDSTAHLASTAKQAPSGMTIRFSMGLRRPESQAVAALRQVSDPASPTYRDFPSRTRIREEYGIQSSVLKAVRSTVRRAGLKMSLDDTGVFVTVKGSARKMGKWLGAPIILRKASPRGLRVKMLSTAGQPPKSVRKYVTDFVAMDVRVAASSSLSYSGRNEGTPRSCLPNKAADLSKYVYSYNQLRTAYGLDTLPMTSAIGKKTRVTVMGQGDGFSRNALSSSASCFNLPKMSFKRVSVPGLTTALPVGTEGNLDVQVVQAVLPAQSNVTVVESAAFDLRDFLAYSTAYSQKHLPHVVTTSYGYCERDLRHLPRGSINLTESVLRRLSLAGSTVFAASGDRGSSDCINNATGGGPRRLAVDYPSSSPHVTAVGGTRITLDAANQRTDEVVWNATDLAPPLGPEKVAGGGGSSIRFARPWWQEGVVSGTKRAVPDLSFHSAGGPAWPIIQVDSDGETISPVGGTSAAAPFVAATVALIAAEQGRPFGLLQPTIYALPESAFHDITVGTNDLHRRGCCKAMVGYDRASGRGAPRFDRWLQDLPPAR